MNEDDIEKPVPVAVPHTELSPGALRGVIEAYVLREGTEYGTHDVDLEVKVAQVLRQLERGDARILFDTVDETIDIVPLRRGERPRP
ncbi:MAG: YheU family protein [Gammaproteobacteria bacterium]|nr:YheU family protein [Gammaproteobacteria bacterium]